MAPRIAALSRVRNETAPDPVEDGDTGAGRRTSVEVTHTDIELGSAGAHVSIEVDGPQCAT